MHTYPLELPDVYSRVFEMAKGVNPELMLAPETLYETLAEDLGEEARWSSFDPRIEWLSVKLEELYPAKVLVITAGAETALDIAWVLKQKTGIQAAVFHEGLSIVERDKAAAWFADQETGAQVLVCSEIGSEGRNFQFAHHLVLFDLPYNPDLLEQRIGRLDRIGQSETIQLHVPYLENSALEVMLRWYHEALDAFEHTCPAGHSVFVKVRKQLVLALESASHDEQLLAASKASYLEMSEALHNGRDRLLEYNSCRTHVAEGLRDRAIEQDDLSNIEDYMDQVFDCFGVDSEPHSQNCIIARPTEHMTHPFPGLREEGMTITYDRETALTFEDAHYLSWEHPLVRDAMDMVMMHESGNTAVTAIKSRALPAGSMLMECIFVLEVAQVEELHSWRYLPRSSIRMVIDEKGNDFGARLPHGNINRVAIPVDNKTAVQVVKAKKKTIKSMQQHAEKQAESQVDALLKKAHDNANSILLREVNRLQALKSVNPNVRSGEIEFYSTQLSRLNDVIESASLRLDSIRLIVVT